MSKTPAPTTIKPSNVIKLVTPKKRAKEKWPASVMARGYSTIPSILLWGQARLGLEPDELNVLLQLVSHWWSADHDPHPAKETVARRMGKSARMLNLVPAANPPIASARMAYPIRSPGCT